MQLSVPPTPIRLLPCKSETLYLLSINSSSPLPSASGNHCYSESRYYSHCYSESHVQLLSTPWTIQSTEFSRSGLEWVAFPFSRGSSQPRDLTQAPALQLYSLPAEPQGKTHHCYTFCFYDFDHIFHSQVT